MPIVKIFNKLTGWYKPTIMFTFEDRYLSINKIVFNY